MKKDMFIDSFAGQILMTNPISSYYLVCDEEKINKEEVPKSLAILP